MTYVGVWFIPNPHWRKPDRNCNFIQETTGQDDPLLRAVLLLKMIHLRGCQVRVKLGTAWQQGMQRAYKLSFSPGIVDTKLSREYVHLAKYASWPMEAVGHICKWFHLQTSKESNQTQRIYSLPAKPVKILTWISKWVYIYIWNLFQAQQGLRLVYSYGLYPCSSQADTPNHRLVGRCFK